MFKHLVAMCVFGAVVATMGTANAEGVTSGMTLTSSSFSDNQLMDRKYAGKGGATSLVGRYARNP